MSDVVNLSDLLPEQRFVGIGRGTVEVHGLDITDLASLLSEHKSLDTLLSGEESKQLNPADIIKEMPTLAIAIIGKAIRCPDMSLVGRIPLSAKIEILMAAWELSVTDPNELGAILEKIKGVVTSLKDKVKA